MNKFSMKKSSKVSLVVLVVLAMAASLLFVACPEEGIEIVKEEIASSRAITTTSWTFQNSASGLVAYDANNGTNTTMKKDIAYTNGMTLLGSQRDFRWVPEQASPGTGFSKGMIQGGGQTAAGKYVLKIDNVQGPFTITVKYTDTGTGDSNTGRYPEIFVNGASKAKGTATNKLSLISYSYKYTGTDKVTVQLGAPVNGIRIYDIVIESGTADSPSTGTAAAGQVGYFDMGSSGSSIVSKNSAFVLTSANGTKLSAAKTVSGITSSVALKLESATKVTFSTTGTTTLKLYADAASKKIKVDNVDRTTDSSGVATVTSFAAGSHTITKGDSVNLIFIVVEGGSTTATTPANVAVTGVAIGSNFSVAVGATKALTATISPSNATNQAVTWSSSSTATATVDSSGVVKGVKAGTATITAKTADGAKTASVTATVTAATASTVAVSSVSIGSNFSITAGTTKALTATISPSNATNQAVTWKSSSTGVATVSSSGVVTGVAAGTSTITVTTTDGSKTASVTATVTAAASSGGSSGGSTGGTNNGTTGSSGSVSITQSGGWEESLFVKWNKVSGAAKYRVEYQKSGGSWVVLDDPLIREYSGNFRADAVGLSAGSYSVRVATVNSSGTVGSYTTSTGITVTAYDRNGFAFSGQSALGAYNKDGTLRSGAKVIYVTSKNAKTVTLDVAESASKTTTGVGVGKILALRQKGYDTTPLAIRFVGMIKEADISSELGSNYLLQVKGKAGSNPLNITVEGIGNDTVAYGWGILVRASRFVEVRNMGFFMFPEDGVSLDTDNQYTWVHNNDFFYGKDGGGDKNKGDGALDSKKSGMATLSYNHFWDSGKCNLLGNGTEDPEKLTYHHNWYDHSDSRHPRVRFHSAHVYNNYYDGVAKYGIGATQGSSIFSEANYFRNTKNPMAISMQGADTKYGAAEKDGSFSSEDGGIIKALNNVFEGTSSTYYKAYSSSNTVEFDAYEVTSKSTTVPSSVKTKKGGKTYNNFDTASGMYSYTADSASAARDKVIKYAGRMQGKAGADFSWTFSSSDDTDSARNSSLSNAVSGYTTKIVSIQGIK